MFHACATAWFFCQHSFSGFLFEVCCLSGCIVVPWYVAAILRALCVCRCPALCWQGVWCSSFAHPCSCMFQHVHRWTKDLASPPSLISVQAAAAISILPFALRHLAWVLLGTWVLCVRHGHLSTVSCSNALSGFACWEPPRFCAGVLKVDVTCSDCCFYDSSVATTLPVLICDDHGLRLRLPSYGSQRHGSNSA
jgi:hypothetical protein